MDSIRIEDMPLLSGYETRDLIHLQRREAGVWNDYHTDIGTYLGGYNTAVFSWDMENDFTDIIACPVGKYLVPLFARFAYLPGAGFTGGAANAGIQTVPSGNWIMYADFTHDGTGQAGSIIPAVGSGPDSNIYGELNEDLLVFGNRPPSFANYGTCRITVSYMVVTPV